MKHSFCFAAALAAVALTRIASANVIVGQTDTFQDGTTDGWFAGGLGMGMVPPIPPHVVGSGGPAGGGDQFLQITASSDFGAGSRIAAINLSQWAGNYNGIPGIAMDLKNFGSTALTIRLLFEDPMGGPPVDQAVTTFGQLLPVSDAWMHAFFAISPASLTVLQGNVNTLLGNTTLIRIIDSPTPTDAVNIKGVLGVDNITATPEPATFLPVFSAFVWLVARRRRTTTSRPVRS